MTRIAPVNLASGRKVFWFDAGEIEIEETDQVVVETVHGQELAKMAGGVFEPTPEQMENFKNELKPVLRVATDDDLYTYSENEQLQDEALCEFRKIIDEQKKDMRAVSVDFSLDRSKAVFCYEAEGRVDFRSMVKTLAKTFHARIEMRQITARERARSAGGFGACGQELCCARLGCGFSHVSIRMAKEQGMSLNQQKISGCCGRLMCCLKYEFESYKDFNKCAPKMNAQVETPEGVARVSGLDMIHDSVILRIDPPEESENKQKGDTREIKRPKIVHVPLSSFDEPEEGRRPNRVGSDAWQEATKPPEIKLESSGYFGDSTKKLTKDSALGDGQAHRANTANRKNATGSVSMVEGASDGEDAKSKNKRRRRRRRRGGAKDRAEANARTENKAQRQSKAGKENAKATSKGARGSSNTGRVRRRRSVTVSSSGTKVEKAAEGNINNKQQTAKKGEDGHAAGKQSHDRQAADKQNQNKQNDNKQDTGTQTVQQHSVRPGQRSSSLREKNNSNSDGAQG